MIRITDHACDRRKRLGLSKDTFSRIAQKAFEEIVSLLHCFSMKMYSKRKLDKIKNTLKEDD
jgi:predicted site-specific integrase-resolvase